MKRLVALVPSVAIIAAVLGADSVAVAQLPHSTGVKQAVALTRITGRITVPALTDAEFTNPANKFGCDNITVVVTSKDVIPPPPGGFQSTPKWIKSVTATGTYSAGYCSYTVNVPSSSAFYVTTGSNNEFGCSVVYVVSPNVGPYTLAKGTTKTQNLAVSSVQCAYLN
jgi:hypothetical protein